MGRTDGRAIDHLKRIRTASALRVNSSDFISHRDDDDDNNKVNIIGDEDKTAPAVYLRKIKLGRTNMLKYVDSVVWK